MREGEGVSITTFSRRKTEMAKSQVKRSYWVSHGFVNYS
jgi:hypothetical protein